MRLLFRDCPDLREFRDERIAPYKTRFCGLVVEEGKFYWIRSETEDIPFSLRDLSDHDPELKEFLKEHYPETLV